MKTPFTISAIKNSPVGKKKYKYIVGIDPGVNTGFAMYNTETKKILVILTTNIIAAINRVKLLYYEHDDLMFVRVEDARKRTWFGNTGKERLKGAGSVERDSKIWEEFLTDLGVNFEMVHPKNNKTKLSADVFKKITGWLKVTNQHGRDAAGLCIGF